MSIHHNFEIKGFETPITGAIEFPHTVELIVGDSQGVVYPNRTIVYISLSVMTYLQSNYSTNEITGIIDLEGIADACAAVQDLELQIGAGTSNSSNAPFYGLYDFSYYAGLWLDTEFTGNADAEIQITGISFEKGSTTAEYPTNNFEIWISEVTETEFPASPAVNGTDMTKTNSVKVFDGNLTWNSGWNEINFDTPYCKANGTNLMVECRNHDTTWQTGYGHGEYDFSPAINRAAHAYNDGTYPTGTATRSNSRINTKFLI